MCNSTHYNLSTGDHLTLERLAPARIPKQMSTWLNLSKTQNTSIFPSMNSVVLHHTNTNIVWMKQNLEIFTLSQRFDDSDFTPVVHRDGLHECHAHSKSKNVQTFVFFFRRSLLNNTKSEKTTNTRLLLYRKPRCPL